MKLVLYSGGDIDANTPLDLELLRLSGKRRPSFTFIPTSFDDAHHYFEEFINYFSPYGVKDYLLFPLDQSFSESQFEKALSRDVVYLSGGNTFDLLYNIKKSKAALSLKKYVINGGVLAGHSAGSIVMTPNIHTATFPKFDHDENHVNIKNLKAMGLVNFEIFPHYVNRKRYVDELIHYSLGLKHPVYAISDGSGIVVDHKKTIFIGDIWGYIQGQKYKIS